MTRTKQSIGFAAILFLTGSALFVHADSQRVQQTNDFTYGADASTLDYTPIQGGKAASPAAAESRAATLLECARRDLQAITQLERQGRNPDVAGPLLHDAFMTMISARQACREGRIHDGLALYDSIGGPTLAGRSGRASTE